MKKKTLISCLSLAMLFSGQVAASSGNVVGYIPDYRFNLVKTMDITMYTHVHFFSVTPLADGSLSWPSGESKASMAQHFAGFKNQAASDAKMMITFGGIAEARSKYFPEMASNPVMRSAFVANAIQLALDWQADGIDIDWEWGYRPSTTEHKNAYIKLMEELNLEADKHGLLISNAISPSAYLGDNTPVEALVDSDYLVIMSYSYNGAWAATTGHHSSLERSARLGFQYWESRGILPEQMHVGVPFYANHYTDATTVGSSFSEFKALTFGQVQELLAKGYQVVEDDWLGTHAYSDTDNSIVFYDSPSNIATKIDYANGAGYGGIVVWEIGQDDANQTLSKTIETANAQDKNTPPVLSGIQDEKISINIVFDPMIGVTASDKEDGDLTDIIVVEGWVDTSRVGSYTLTYSASDSEGLTTTQDRLIKVIDLSTCMINEYPNWPRQNWAGVPNHAIKGDLMSHKGVIYEALWYTTAVPGAHNSWAVADIDGCDPVDK